MAVAPIKMALLCNYELLPERVGGMDYFFWMFDAKCKANGIAVDWFFPNTSDHGEYSKLTIFDSHYQNIENSFLDYCIQNKPVYSHILTHFIELCTPFFKKIKKYSAASVLVIDHNPRPIAGYPFKKKLEKKVKGFLYSKYIDQFVGVSNYTVNELIKDFGRQIKTKTCTIYNGVLIVDIKERLERKQRYPRFLVASHLRESKGIQDLIVAVSGLPASILSGIQIDVYGDGPHKAFLIQQVEDLQLGLNFKFMGSQPNLNNLYCEYDYMLQPTHMECFSLSILESLAANVPVITTNVGGNEEVIKDGENGYIFKVKESHALKEIIENVYLGHKRIEINTRMVIENNFSLLKMVEQHLALVLDNKS
jgi:glycosyltransferase involved in cell wall biosynthesis